MTDVTTILFQIEQGDPTAAEQLFPLVYDKLRELAAAKLRHERPGHTLQATALVHEAYVRLIDVNYVQRWTSSRHFFGAAAEAMRRILVDSARRRLRSKHGGDRQRVTLDLEDWPAPPTDDLLDSLDTALRQFERVDAVAAELLKLRYFAGLTLKDAAESLGVAPRSADRLWAYAKAWLRREIDGSVDGST